MSCITFFQHIIIRYAPAKQNLPCVWPVSTLGVCPPRWGARAMIGADPARGGAAGGMCASARTPLPNGPNTPKTIGFDATSPGTAGACGATGGEQVPDFW